MELKRFYELGGVIEHEVLAFITYELSTNEEKVYSNDKKLETTTEDSPEYYRVYYKGDILGETEYFDDSDAVEFVECMDETKLLNGGYLAY